MHIGSVNCDESSGWNENACTRSPSVTNLRVSRFRRITSTACLFNIIMTISLILMTCIAVAFALSYYGVWSNSSSMDVVTIFCGRIKGVREDDYIIRFMGIPYALPPINENRFKLPIQLSSKELCDKAWQMSNTTLINSVYHTQHYKPSCLQLIPKSTQNDFIGSENCLYLNIHMPIDKRSVKQPKPVIIILDGLFFMYSNEPKQPSSQTIQKVDAIHVTFNYRLGAFGFLPHPYERIPNLGLHDQFLVMKWVRNNIAQFGGDPLNVVLFGYGSGATCALTLLYSPISNPLFDKLWITAPAMGLSNTTTQDMILMTNKILDCQNQSNPYNCSSQKLKNPQNVLRLWNWTMIEKWLIKTMLSLPTVKKTNHFEEQHFINILINDNIFVNLNNWNKPIQNNMKPIVFGQTSHEVSIYPIPKTIPFWDKNIYKNYIINKLKLNDYNLLNQSYKQFLSSNFNNLNCTHLNDENVNDNINNDNNYNHDDWLSNLMLLITDIRLTCPLSELVNQFTNQINPIYQYYLTGLHRRFDPYSLLGFIPYSFHGWDAMLYLRTYDIHIDFNDPNLLKLHNNKEKNQNELRRLKRISDLLNLAMYEFSRNGAISNWHKSIHGKYNINLIDNDYLCKYLNIMKKRCDIWKIIFNNNLFDYTWKF